MVGKVSCEEGLKHNLGNLESFGPLAIPTYRFKMSLNPACGPRGDGHEHNYWQRHFQYVEEYLKFHEALSMIQN